MLSMQKQPGLEDGTSAISVYTMRPRDLYHRTDALSRYSQTPATLVSGDVVRDEPKAWSYRRRTGPSLGIGQLSDGVDVAV